MFRHVSLYRMVPEADLQAAIDILNALPAKVPGIINWTLGAHRSPPSGRSGHWDYGLVCDFRSFEDLQTYNSHPAHFEAVKAVLPMISAHAICDLSLTRINKTFGASWV